MFSLFVSGNFLIYAKSLSPAIQHPNLYFVCLFESISFCVYKFELYFFKTVYINYSKRQEWIWISIQYEIILIKKILWINLDPIIIVMIFDIVFHPKVNKFSKMFCKINVLSNEVKILNEVMIWEYFCINKSKIV